MTKLSTDEIIRDLDWAIGTVRKSASRELELQKRADKFKRAVPGYVHRPTCEPKAAIPLIEYFQNQESQLYWLRNQTYNYSSFN